MELYWIWLSELQGIGPVTQKKLLAKFKDPYGVYTAAKSQIMDIKGLGEYGAELILGGKCLDDAKLILQKINSYNIKLLTYDDALYPEEVRRIEKAPILLYYKGYLRNSSMGVGIVGTRRCTEYGKRTAREAAEFLAAYDVPVISGMAKGIDGYAQTACLKAGGYTLAFLGNGLDICYPGEHEELMKAIINNGAVLSQYPPGTKPIASNFPARNLLISAWSEKLLVVEAGEKSGSLITADYSLRMGRKVYAVPNSIYSRESMGSNRLLEKGAHIYLCPYSLITDMAVSSRKEPEIDNAVNRPDIACINYKALSPLENVIIELLKDGPVNIEEIIRRVDVDKSLILETISIMELKEIIEEKQGCLIASGPGTT